MVGSRVRWVKMKRTFARQGRPWHFVLVSFSGGGGGQGAVGAVQGLLLRECAVLNLVRVLAEVPVGAWRMASHYSTYRCLLVGHARALASCYEVAPTTEHPWLWLDGLMLSHFITQHVDRMRSKRGRGRAKAAEKSTTWRAKHERQEGRKGLVSFRGACLGWADQAESLRAKPGSLCVPGMRSALQPRLKGD